MPSAEDSQKKPTRLLVDPAMTRRALLAGAGALPILFIAPMPAADGALVQYGGWVLQADDLERLGLA